VGGVGLLNKENFGGFLLGELIGVENWLRYLVNQY